MPCLDAVALPSDHTRELRRARPARRPVTVADRFARGDARIAAGLRRGDRGAVEDLYRLHGATTFGYLVRALGDRSAAEDVQQEVYLDAWRRASTYDAARGSLLTWLMTIARSRAIDHLRRRVPEPRDPAGIAEAADREDPDAHADHLIEQWRLAGLVAKLPDEEALLLRMRFHDGLSQTEIAERTGIALGTVKMRMVQGLGRLRDMVEAEEAA